MNWCEALVPRMGTKKHSGIMPYLDAGVAEMLHTKVSPPGLSGGQGRIECVFPGVRRDARAQEGLRLRAACGPAERLAVSGQDIDFMAAACGAKCSQSNPARS